MTEHNGIQGTMLIGADGATYFIPSNELAAFKVPDTRGTELVEQLDDEVAGFAMNSLKAGGDLGLRSYPAVSPGRVGRSIEEIGGGTILPYEFKSDVR